MDNRERFRELLKANGIKQKECHGLISAVTMRPCAPRTVRSWLNDPDKPSSSPCPDWAVAALEKAIRYMKIALERRQQAPDADAVAE